MKKFNIMSRVVNGESEFCLVFQLEYETEMEVPVTGELLAELSEVIQARLVIQKRERKDRDWENWF